MRYMYISISQPSGTSDSKRLNLQYSGHTTEGFSTSLHQACLYDLIVFLRMGKMTRIFSVKGSKNETKRKATLEMKNMLVRNWRAETFAPEEGLFLGLYRHLGNQPRSTATAGSRVSMVLSPNPLVSSS